MVLQGLRTKNSRQSLPAIKGLILHIYKEDRCNTFTKPIDAKIILEENHVNIQMHRMREENKH